MWSEFFIFLSGCVATGLTIKITTKIRNRNSKSNAQTGDNVANGNSVAAGTINAPVSINNFHGHIPSTEPKTELSRQAKSILKDFLLSKQNQLITFAPSGVVEGVQAENVSIEVYDFLDVDDDLDNLVKYGYLKRQQDTKIGRRYCWTSAGKKFATTLTNEEC